MDYPNLWGFLRDMYQHDGIGKETVNMAHAKVSYMVSRAITFSSICDAFLDNSKAQRNDLRWQICLGHWSYTKNVQSTSAISKS